MASERTLTAILRGKGNLKKTLGGIADKSEDAARGLTEAASSAKAASKAFDRTDDKGDNLNRTLKSVAGNATIAGGALEGIENSADDVGDEMSAAERKTSGFTDTLNENTAAITANVAAQEALQSSVDESGDEASQSSRRFGGYNATLASLAGMSVLSGLGDGPDVDSRRGFFSGAPMAFDFDPLKNLFGGGDSDFSLKDTLKGALPSKKPLTETVDEARELANQIERIADGNPNIKAELEGIESFRSLRKRLKKLDLKSIDRLDLGDRDKSVRGLFDELLDNGPPLTELSTEFDDIDFDTRKRTIPIALV